MMKDMKGAVVAAKSIENSHSVPDSSMQFVSSRAVRASANRDDIDFAAFLPQESGGHHVNDTGDIEHNDIGAHSKEFEHLSELNCGSFDSFSDVDHDCIDSLVDTNVIPSAKNISSWHHHHHHANQFDYHGLDMIPKRKRGVDDSVIHPVTPTKRSLTFKHASLPASLPMYTMDEFNGMNHDRRNPSASDFGIPDLAYPVVYRPTLQKHHTDSTLNQGPAMSMKPEHNYNAKSNTNNNNKTNNVTSKSKRTSLFRGVSCCGMDRKWQARIRDTNRVRYLGRFGTEVEAAFVYDDAARALKGDQAPTNFVKLNPASQKMLINAFVTNNFRLPEDMMHLVLHSRAKMRFLGKESA